MTELARHATAAERSGGRVSVVSIRSVAGRMSISEGYLEELARHLRNAGIIHGTRGRRGGYVLAKSAQNIALGEIIRLLDGPIVFARCQDSTASAPCPTEDSCASRHFFGRLKTTIDRELDSMTLADLVADYGLPTTDRRSVGSTAVVRGL